MYVNQIIRYHLIFHPPLILCAETLLKAQSQSLIPLVASKKTYDVTSSAHAPSAPILGSISAITSNTVSSAPPGSVPAAADPSASSSVINANANDAESGDLNGVKGTKSGQTNLSSFAIVGIVGGILVGFVVVYLVWYQWVSPTLS